MNTERIREIREQAVRLARENKRAEPGIVRVYWFPDENEVRLLELEAGIPPSAGDTVEPFHFAPSPRDNLRAPSGIALIRPDEFRKLELPEDWGDWDRAEELEIAQ
jgi:hypothetical protein